VEKISSLLSLNCCEFIYLRLRLRGRAGENWGGPHSPFVHWVSWNDSPHRDWKVRSCTKLTEKVSSNGYKCVEDYFWGKHLWVSAQKVCVTWCYRYKNSGGQKFQKTRKNLISEWWKRFGVLLLQLGFSSPGFFFFFCCTEWRCCLVPICTLHSQPPFLSPVLYKCFHFPSPCTAQGRG